MKYFGIIGYPISHSASPVMHNSAFKYLNIDAIYLSFEVKPEELRNAIFGSKALGFKGLNVTIPYKEKVVEYIKPVGIAKKICAVNTIDLQEFKGYNTDAYGALKALEEAKVDVEDKNVLIVGAGGSARAIAFALAERGATIVITNRTESRGLKLAEDVRSVGDCIFYPYDRITDLKGKIDMVINCTPLGMKGFEQKLPVPESLIENIIVFDIVYNPIETQLIKLAKRRGCKVVYGLDMLVYQGAKAFKIWTGLDPPVDIMRKAVIDFLSRY